MALRLLPVGETVSDVPRTVGMPEQSAGGLHLLPAGEQTTETAPEEAAPAEAPEKKKSGVLESIARSGGQIIGSAGSAGRDVGLPGSKAVEEFGQGIADKYPASITSISEALHDPGQTIKESIAEAVPQVGLNLASAYAGGEAGGAIGGGIGALFGGVGAAPGAAIGATIGAGVGAFAPSFIQEYGGIRQTQREEGTDNKAKALAGGTAAAALDLIAPESAVPRKLVTKSLEKVAGKGVKGVVKAVGKGVAKEAITEGAQTAVERAAAGQDLLSPEAVEDYGVSAIKGGVGGGVIEGGGHIIAPHKGAAAAPGAPEQQGGFNPERGTGAAAPPDTGAAAAPAGGGYDAQFGYGKYGDASFKPTEKTMGEVYDYGQNVLRPQTKAAGFGKGSSGEVLGTSAVGKYQMVGGTLERLAKARYGSDWRNINFTPGVQEQLAEDLFNESKGGNLKAIWESLPDATPGAYKDMTWEQARDIIAKGESGGGGGGYAVAQASGHPALADVDIGPELNFDSADDVIAFLHGGKKGEAPQSTKDLAAGIAAGDDKAQAALAAERAAIDKKLDDLAEKPKTVSVDKQMDVLHAREDALIAATQLAEHAARRRSASSAPSIDIGGSTIQAGAPPRAVTPETVQPVSVVQPTEAPPVPGMADIPSTPAVDAVAQQQQALDAFHAERNAHEATARADLLKEVIKDPDTRNAEQRYVAMLKRAGLSLTLSPEERHELGADAIRRQARGTYLTAEEAQAQMDQREAAEREARVQEAAKQQEALQQAGTQDTELGVRAAPEAAAPAKETVEAKPSVQPEPAPAPERTHEQNIRERMTANADQMGGTQAVWYKKGANDALQGVSEPPPGTTTSEHYKQGQAFVERERDHQAREHPTAPTAETRGTEAPAIPADLTPEAPTPRPKGGQARRREEIARRAEELKAAPARRAQALKEKAAREKQERADAAAKAKQEREDAKKQRDEAKRVADARAARAKEMAVAKKPAPPAAEKVKAASKAKAEPAPKPAPPAAEKAKTTSKAKTAAKAAEKPAQAPRATKTPTPTPTPEPAPARPAEVRRTQAEIRAEAQAERDTFFREHIDAAVDRSEITGETAAAIERASQSKLANGDFALPMSQIRQMLQDAKDEYLKLAHVRTREADATDVTADDIDPAVEAAITAQDKEDLAEFYGRKTWDSRAARRFQADVLKAIRQGLDTVHSSIRHIVKKAATAALAIHLVFAPVALNQTHIVEFGAPSAQAATMVQAKPLVKTTLDPALAKEMSPNARVIAADLIPQLGKGEYAGKAVILADKPGGRMYVFDGAGNLIHQGSALFGADYGDLPTQGKKITPSGKYVLHRVSNDNPEYPAGTVFQMKGALSYGGDGRPRIVALHGVWQKEAVEREAKLATPTVDDNKVSFGCINTSKQSFINDVMPLADQLDEGVAIVVPETADLGVSPYAQPGTQQQTEAPTPVRLPTEKREQPGLPSEREQKVQEARTRSAGRRRQGRTGGRLSLKHDAFLGANAQKLAEVVGDDKRLRAELDRRGLHGVKLLSTTVEDLSAQHGVEGAAGHYEEGKRGLLGTMSIALDSPRGPFREMDHETVHVLRGMNAIRPGDWAILRGKAMANKEEVDAIRTRYADEVARAQREVDTGTADQKTHDLLKTYAGPAFEEAVEEEVVAEYVAEKLDNPSAAEKPIFDRIKATLEAIGNWLRGRGYRTSDDILKDIDDGTLARSLTGRVPSAASTPSGVFSLYRASNAPPRMKTAQARVKQNAVADAADSAWAAAGELANKKVAWLSNTKDVASMAAKLMPSSKTYVEAISKNHGLAREFHERTLEITDEFHKLAHHLRGAGNGTVSKLLNDITRQNKWPFMPNYSYTHTAADGTTTQVIDKKFNDAAAKLYDADMAKRMKAMGPSAENVIRAMLRFNYDAKNELHSATRSAIAAEYDPQIKEAQDANDVEKWIELEQAKAEALAYNSRLYDTREGTPYMSLRQDGDFVVIGKSAEFKAAEKADDKEKIRELKGDENHYMVRFVDSYFQGHRIGKRVGTKFPHVDVLDRNTYNGDAVSQKEMFLAFDRFKSAIENDKDIEGRLGKEMNRLARDFYLHSLSEYSALKGELHRENISSEDPVTGETMHMVKAFVGNASAMASYTAAMANNGAVQKAIRSMKAEADKQEGQDRTTAQRLFNEMMNRHAFNLTRKPMRYVDKLLRGTSFYMLMSVPTYHLINATQTPLLSAPITASKYGYVQAQAAIGKAFLDFMTSTKNIGLTERMHFDDVPADIKGIVQWMAEHGHLDAGHVDELNNWESNGLGVVSDAWNLGDRFSRRFPQRVEVMNRFMAGVAHYRLAIKAGKTDAEAKAEVGRLIDHTHGDYSGWNTSGALNSLEKYAGPVGRVAGQFKKFQLNMASLLVREMNRTFKGATTQEKIQGARAIGFTMAHMAAVGGIIGLPGAGFALWAFGQIMAAIGDDDEWRDAKWDLREWLGAGRQGKEKNWMADMIYKGAPYALGVDLSEKVGMGNVFALAPFLDTTDVLTKRDKMYQAVGQLALGASGGIIARAQGALDWGHTTGDYTRFIASVMPSASFGNIEKAMRLRSEGLRAKSGEVLMKPEDFSLMDAILIGSGLTPSKLSAQAETASAKYDVKGHYQDITTTMKYQYAEAKADGDRQKMAELRRDWMGVQQAQRRDGIAVAPLATLTKAVRERARRQHHVAGGVGYDRSTRAFVRATEHDTGVLADEGAD